MESSNKKKRILFHPSSFKPKLKTSSNTHNRQKGLIEFVKFQFNVSIASKQIELDHRFISDFFMHLLSIHRTIYSISSITWIKRNSRAILSSLSLFLSDKSYFVQSCFVNFRDKFFFLTMSMNILARNIVN